VKVRNGRAVLYSSVTTAKVNAMSMQVPVVVWYGSHSLHDLEFHGRNDIRKHHTGSSDRTGPLPSRIFNLYWTKGHWCLFV